MASLPPGTQLGQGRYTVVRELNRGGTAVVYEGLQAGSGHSVALKARRWAGPGCTGVGGRVRLGSSAGLALGPGMQGRRRRRAKRTDPTLAPAAHPLGQVVAVAVERRAAATRAACEREVAFARRFTAAPGLIQLLDFFPEGDGALVLVVSRAIVVRFLVGSGRPRDACCSRAGSNRPDACPGACPWRRPRLQHASPTRPPAPACLPACLPACCPQWELVRGADLLDFLNAQGGVLPEPLAARLFAQLVRGWGWRGGRRVGGGRGWVAGRQTWGAQHRRCSCSHSRAGAACPPARHALPLAALSLSARLPRSSTRCSWCTPRALPTVTSSRKCEAAGGCGGRGAVHAARRLAPPRRSSSPSRPRVGLPAPCPAATLPSAAAPRWPPPPACQQP